MPKVVDSEQRRAELTRVTAGEIALDAGDLSGFHNTTTVVLAIPK